MSDRGERPLPDDLLPVAEWLREERPSLDGFALDRAVLETGAFGDSPTLSPRH